MVCVRLKTDTLVSKIASTIMRPAKGRALATAIGKTIHLHNITPEDFINNKTFLRHELQHIIQAQTTKGFRAKYVIETIRRGYYNNRYEVEARAMERYAYPSGYVVYNDELLCVKAKDFSDVELAQLIGKLKFRNYPKVIVK